MKIRLDIISDPICPWCYIGKARLHKAFAERPHHPFWTSWRPFQLNPEMPRDGMDRRAYLEAKFGGPEGAKAVYSRIETTAEADGLPIRFDAIKRTPNTIDAHRVIRWAMPGDQQDAVVDGLFERYFLLGDDIGDRETLADVAATAGMERDAVLTALAGDVDRDAVRKENEAARSAGVSGVPTFIVNGKHVISGAQETALWVRVIDELAVGLAGKPQADAGALS